MSRSKEPQLPVEVKVRVVLSVLSGEMSMSEAARRHGVSGPAVARWRDRFIESGKAGLENAMPGPSGSGSQAERKLRAEAEAEAEQLKLALADLRGHRLRHQVLPGRHPDPDQPRRRRPGLPACRGRRGDPVDRPG